MSGSTVPAPHPGNVHNVVPARTVATRPAVGLRQVAKATPAVSIRLVSIRSTRTVAQGPGEVAGAGLALRIRITNSGHSAADLGNVVVNLTDARKRPAIATTGGPARAFSGTLRPGHSATGRYLFTVPADERSPIHVSVAYAGAAPVVLFTGNAS